jgi:hypothetical protein
MIRKLRKEIQFTIILFLQQRIYTKCETVYLHSHVTCNNHAYIEQKLYIGYLKRRGRMGMGNGTQWIPSDWD